MTRTAEQIDADLQNAKTRKEVDILMAELDPILEERARGPIGDKIREEARKYLNEQKHKTS